MTAIGPDTIVRRRAGVVDSTLDGETLALDTQSGEVLVFEGTGRAIWEQLTAPRSARDICTVLEAAYAIAPAQCLGEVTAFLEGLAREGLVTCD